MNAEPVMNQDTFPTEPTHRWADDGGVLTEERSPEPDSVEQESVEQESAEQESAEQESAEPESAELEPAEPQTSMETSSKATSDPVVSGPLLSDEAEQAFLSRWAEIQVGFVEDPPQSVRDADQLIDEIAAALLEAFQARRTDLAADWQDGSPGTEELRLALRRYRAFVGVILPK
ncbi:hypothetical protein KGQ20_12750 [Catenulispora sp. NF23]|uniref:hypothetical protein n=1 Tax=Catenulispora pinistramenti TaxID=2705254 RepID=UPI001BAAD762|nr:hypothetical protein [Catenulispora pinistramenti]MBS2533640.1 hypothetical protein [Catenulispora pinistramenti]